MDNAQLVENTAVNNTANGVYISGGPLTTSVTHDNAPGLLLNEVDRRVTKIRPSATPIDQITRLAGSRPAQAMVVDYYSVDTKPVSASITSVEENSDGDDAAILVTVDKPIFDASETLLVRLSDTSTSTPTPSAPSLDDDDEEDLGGGSQNSGVEPEATTTMRTLMLYVSATLNQGRKLKLVPIVAEGETAPTLTSGDKLVRMGRAATELDVQTAQFEALPVKATNNCQIFKMQIEESTYHRIAAKEVSLHLSDQEEVAIIDMRQGMEKSFLFGTKMRYYDADKHEEVLFTGGIWHQAGRDFSFGGSIDTSKLVDMMQEAFTGNGSNARKIMLAGSTLIAALSKLDYNRVVQAGDVKTHWGIDFDEIHSKFGTLLVKHSEIFDACGFADSALIIDPEYLTKYVHVPFTAERLDLRSSGQRNCDAVVLTEASCLVLRHPNAHVRVKL